MNMDPAALTDPAATIHNLLSEKADGMVASY